MITIRSNVFETNSSSAHCIVIAPDDQFDKFVAGELYASYGEYKGFAEARLLTLDEVYELYTSYINREIEWLKKHHEDTSDMVAASKEVFQWCANHPKEFDELFNEEKLADNVPECVLNFKVDNESACGTLNYWLDDINNPMSYAKVVYESENFTTSYDGYDSEAPSSKDGKTSMHAVWYY